MNSLPFGASCVSRGYSEDRLFQAGSEVALSVFLEVQALAGSGLDSVLELDRVRVVLIWTRIGRVVRRVQGADLETVVFERARGLARELRFELELPAALLAPLLRTQRRQVRARLGRVAAVEVYRRSVVPRLGLDGLEPAVLVVPLHAEQVFSPLDLLLFVLYVERRKLSQPGVPPALGFFLTCPAAGSTRFRRTASGSSAPRISRESLSAAGTPSGRTARLALRALCPL